DRLQLLADLNHAIERDEFELYYQPKVEIATGRVLAVEALLRWRHPHFGTVPPLEFITIAEDTGLIVAIDKWVIEHACAQNRAWQETGLPDLRMAVNISGAQFRQSELFETIRHALAASRLAAECLEIEVNESVVMHNPAEAIVALEKLSQIGVQVAIDDFGTSYSSLSYLKRLPIDKLKIDRSFIREVSSDLDDAAIVKATIGLAHNLRLKVVAEGVETAEQLQILRSLGCDAYQGAFKSRPLTAKQFESSIRAEFRLPAEPAFAS
ncbi:MAG TPA: EAL domain-containing protein, partial [Burkholderiales bacterium]|nr:EAL domain-containing protein [Burkholderiales bacterium]